MPRTALNATLVLLPLLLLCSCAGIPRDRVTAWEQNQHVLPLDTSGINGRWYNKSTDSSSGELLWEYLQRDVPSKETDLVDVAMIPPDHVRFSLIRRDSVIATYERSWKPNATHITIGGHRTRTIVGPLLWALSDYEMRIGNNPEHQLSLLCGMSGGVMLVVLPIGGASAVLSSAHERVR